MSFTPEQVKALSAKLDPANVKERAQAGRKLSYIEGWKAIDEANRIFGFDAWTSETTEIRCVAENPRKIGNQAKDGWSVSYIAKVRVIVSGIIREGVGSGHGIDVDLGLAHESAIKEAETDARKRSLMTFGNPFGLALYDKTQASVGVDEPKPARKAVANDTPSLERQAEIADSLIGAMEFSRSVEDLKAWKEEEKKNILLLGTEQMERVGKAFKAREAKLHDAAQNYLEAGE